MKSFFPVVVITILAGVVVGCATLPVDQRRVQLQDQGQPPAYIDGYVSGCDNGTIVAGNPWYAPHRDDYLYRSDSVYSKGWNDGFQICLSQKRSAQK